MSERAIRQALPTRREQLAYHAALEKYFEERGLPMKIVRFMSKWEIRWNPGVDLSSGARPATESGR